MCVIDGHADSAAAGWPMRWRWPPGATSTCCTPRRPRPPTALTERHHLPTSPLLDAMFLFRGASGRRPGRAVLSGHLLAVRLLSPVRAVRQVGGRPAVLPGRSGDVPSDPRRAVPAVDPDGGRSTGGSATTSGCTRCRRAVTSRRSRGRRRSTSCACSTSARSKLPSTTSHRSSTRSTDWRVSG